MRASDYPCVFVGRTADHLHHPTARNAEGTYLDEDLVVPLSRRQHVAEHVGLRIAGLGENSTLPANILRLRRIAHFLVRLGEHHGIGFVVLPVSFVRTLGRVLQQIADESEHR